MFWALDVGKSAHHGAAVLADGRTTSRQAAAQQQAPAAAAVPLVKRRGKILVAVDQDASIGTLTVAVAATCGCEVAYLPGLSNGKLPPNPRASTPSAGRNLLPFSTKQRAMPRASLSDGDLMSSEVSATQGKTPALPVEHVGLMISQERVIVVRERTGGSQGDPNHRKSRARGRRLLTERGSA
ncbi:IS110 family transposase [Streptomyces phaeochromogenes]|uniref:IS110 family transposase n=1 Tax=Streptomyces phaeochromogenes TaxID=1923 RepID=UPI00338E0792